MRYIDIVSRCVTYLLLTGALAFSAAEPVWAADSIAQVEATTTGSAGSEPKVEDDETGRPDDPSKTLAGPDHVGAGDPPLLVGGRPQRNPGVAAQYAVIGLGAVARSPHRGVRRLLVLVDPDGAGVAGLEAGGGCQLHVRPHPGRHQNQIGVEVSLVGGHRGHAAARSSLRRSDGDPGVVLDAVLTKEIGKHWRIRLLGRNLLTPTIERTQLVRPSTTNIETEETVRSYTSGAQISLGLNYSF